MLREVKPPLAAPPSFLFNFLILDSFCSKCGVQSCHKPGVSLYFISSRDFYFLYDLSGCGLYFHFLPAFFGEMNMNYREYFNLAPNHAARLPDWTELWNYYTQKGWCVFPTISIGWKCCSSNKISIWLNFNVAERCSRCDWNPSMSAYRSVLIGAGIFRLSAVGVTFTHACAATVFWLRFIPLYFSNLPSACALPLITERNGGQMSNPGREHWWKSHLSNSV